MIRVLFFDDFHRPSILNEVDRDPVELSQRRLRQLLAPLSQRKATQLLTQLSQRKRRPRRQRTVPYAAARFATSCGFSRVPLINFLRVPDNTPKVAPQTAPRCLHDCLCRPGETTSLICAACRMGWPAWDDTRKLSKSTVVCNIPIKDGEDLEENDVLSDTEVRRLEQAPDDEDAFSHTDEELVDEAKDDLDE